MKKNSLNPTTVITIIGAVIIFMIIYTGKLNYATILSVLGAVCLSYGIWGMIQGMRLKKDPENHAEINLLMPVIQLILGGFLILLGIVETLHLNLSQNVWNGLLLVFVIVVIVGAIAVRHRKK